MLVKRVPEDNAKNDNRVWHTAACLSPRHTGRRPRCDHGDLGNPPDRRVVVRYQKNAPLYKCNRDRAALARRSDARPLWAQLRFHYDLCANTTLIPRPHGALDTRSVRPSATLQRCYYDTGDPTALLGRSRCVCCAHTVSVLRSYGDHRRCVVYLTPFHGKLECFQLIFFKCKYEVSYLENESWFHSSLNN